ncbi:helix-turn-helix transcriptional regulator [Streptomyces sp. KS 21]|uniref:helix-turn-helix transcriptional regulator n=1 Tax=Streptomyces sp. KS 21 TaxID=2485150 RepID=UPI0010EA4750|nr:helix-turn-helix transcriptional regulator [Streptomyces sp. KS 21]TDU75355.1 regulatory LuxR family protein [Streptomyces sp. KS 21]
MSAVAELTRESAPVRVPAAPDRLSLLRQAGDGLMPYPALVRLLGAATTAGTTAGPATVAGTSAATAPGLRSAAPPDAPRLTVRQTAVLTLMAEGHGNAVIARTLSCSEHTIKNVIYELMSRLQARNRAHAVACAVRHSLI